MTAQVHRVRLANREAGSNFLRRARVGVAVAGLAALADGLAGCGTDDDSAEPSKESTMQTPTPAGSSSPPPSGPGALAAADLAKRLGIDVGAVTVVKVESVTWRDGSLGCPEPGKMYTQALVEGERIELEADGETYVYHSGGSRAPFLCENPQPPAP